jgi:hypothetical protein
VAGRNQSGGRWSDDSCVWVRAGAAVAAGGGQSGSGRRWSNDGGMRARVGAAASAGAATTA